MHRKTLQILLKEYFIDWLKHERNMPENTIRSYRDSIMLFLEHLAAELNRPVQTISFSDLSAKAVLNFLNHIEKHRKCKISTRNCRLAAVKSFMKFSSRSEPSLHSQCNEVLTLCVKKSTKPAIDILSHDEVDSILEQPSARSAIGRRDQALFNLLYKTGVRLQEALDLRRRDVRVSTFPQISVTGKGRKQRNLPLTKLCAKLLERVMRELPDDPQAIIFQNNRGEPLGQSGVRDNLRKYTIKAADVVTSLKGRRVWPHIFRHTFACHMLAAGVDIATIGNFLGHESLETTSIYLQSDMATKRKALMARADRDRGTKLGRTKMDPSIISWLKSL